MRIALWTVLLAAIVQPVIAAPMVHFTDIIADDSRTGFAGFEGAPSTVNLAGGVSYLGFSGGQYDELWLSATNGRPAAPNSGTAQALQIDSIEVIPEPAVLVLVAIGVMGFGCGRRRRNHP